MFAGNLLSGANAEVERADMFEMPLALHKLVHYGWRLQTPVTNALTYRETQLSVLDEAQDKLLSCLDLSRKSHWGGEGSDRIAKPAHYVIRGNSERQSFVRCTVHFGLNQSADRSASIAHNWFINKSKTMHQYLQLVTTRGQLQEASCGSGRYGSSISHLRGPSANLFIFSINKTRGRRGGRAAAPPAAARAHKPATLAFSC
ncbi:hypothetical protein EVAR_87261_1 [Eumeta japonica]|uniref:Uncharacterized protein n=1 Tax=Eumeta variegata TaxID=151549 RepID=A0A4C1YPR3_EUMVA|nr:hypothetical protein EVAR_87261_1 [Eumeta japonica]